LRHLYSLTLYLLLPAVLLRLWWRGGRVPGYRRNWAERFGYVEPPAAPGSLWIHAVSVGEVRAAEPLVKVIRRRWPQRRVLMTTTTPTGRATVRRLFGGAVRCLYLPYDLPGAVGRFLARVQPALGVVMESEIWPNLYQGMKARGTPLLLVNARLSEVSLRRYRLLGVLARTTLDCVTCIAAQTRPDAARFIRMGAPRQRVCVTGNLKFEALLPAGFDQRVALLRARLGAQRPVWTAGSTHRGEERHVLQAHRLVLQRVPGALLLLAPRHPERAAELVGLCSAAGLACCRYSELGGAATGAPVVIVDVLGELAVCYGASRAAFLGGSLVDAGGHNPLEALLAGAPVLTGPWRENFADIYQALLAQHAAEQVATAAELARTLTDWLGGSAVPGERLAAGRGVIAAQRGALQKTLQLLDAVLPGE
jgi:3-deoxy-D-manno-octulosonic-acid transferase